MDNKKYISDIINESIIIKEKLLNEKYLNLINKIAEVIVDCYKKNGKLFLCGNGGSAADAQHIAAELTGKFNKKRPPLNAEALTVNTSYLTAVTNDFKFEYVFERLIEAKADSNDILIGISTSGNSKNVINAVKKANKMNLKTISLTGKGGGRIAKLTDYSFNVDSNKTPRIQEIHILVGHILCELIENKLFS